MILGADREAKAAVRLCRRAVARMVVKAEPGTFGRKIIGRHGEPAP